jgi:hypothetical protein
MKPKTRNQAFHGAYWKGYEARKKGKPKVSPYPDWRTSTGEVTFSRAFDRYWREGWEDADEKCKLDYQDE